MEFAKLKFLEVKPSNNSKQTTSALSSATEEDGNKVSNLTS